MTVKTKCIKQPKTAQRSHSEDSADRGPQHCNALPLASTDVKEGARKRFWSKVDARGKLECWPWLAGTDKGNYGLFWLNGRNMRASKVAYAISNGDVRRGLCICHTCDNPICVNPNHLKCWTNLRNRRDSCAKGRQASGRRHGTYLHPERILRGDNHPMHLHPESVPRGERNGCAKLTADQVLEIRRMPGPPSRIARIFGISRRHAANLRAGRFWRHILPSAGEK